MRPAVAQDMKIDIWSDVVCPFCYIGKRRLEQALESFPHRDEVEIVWHSFQLDPTAPATSTETTTEHLSRKYGTDLEQARQMNARIERMAAEVGLEYHLEEARLGNTFDAHRLIHLAATQGLAGAAHERFMRGYFTEREQIGDHDTLVRLATDVGLEEARVREVLAGDEFADAVHQDVARAQAYGATGVPFFVLAEAVGVSGAQPVEVFSQALEQAWAKANPLQMVGAGATTGTGRQDGDGCQDGSCSV